MSSRAHGKAHPVTLISMNYLAFTFKLQGGNEEAISLMENFLQQGKQVFSPQNPRVLSSVEALDEWRTENMEI